MKEKTKLQKGFAPIFIILIIVLGIGGISGTYGAFEYHKTSKLVKEAEQLKKEEKYNEAIEKLEFAQSKLFGKIILKQKIGTELDTNKKLLEDKSEYTQGLEEFDKENWSQAKELLSRVSETSPYYRDSKNKIEEAEKKITGEQIAETTTEAEETAKATCRDECSQVGLKRCYNVGNYGYQTCGDYNSDGCLEWSPTTICPSDTITCQDGICIRQEQKEQKCSDRTLYNQCSTNKPSYCENGNLINKCSTCGCPSGQQCQSNGSCTVPTQMTCQNECSSTGSKRCSDNGYQICGNYDSDSCLEWSSITDCPPDTICQSGDCIQQKCTDGTSYGQCSTDKPKYCDNGILLNKCSTCGCPLDKKCLENENCSQFSENVDCENTHYKMAFVLLVRNPTDATSDRLNKLRIIKNQFSSDFSTATRNLASMDTKDDIYIMTDQNFFSVESIYSPIYGIAKNFYETHNDIYDFISIYTTFPTELLRSYYSVVQNIKGMGQVLYDNSDLCGTKGKLKGVNFMKNIDFYFIDNLEINMAVNSAINSLLHETGHRWCCYVGDNFARGKGGSRLEIIDGGIHFYLGLQSPYEGESTAMASRHWIPNNDGTFRNDDHPHGLFGYTTKYHPFLLYFMGLLPKEEYDSKFWIYDAGITAIEKYNIISATPYKQVGVNDIIEVEGERICVK